MSDFSLSDAQVELTWLLDLFEQWDRERQEIQNIIDKHTEAIKALAARLGRTEDYWANRMDEECPGWRALLRARKGLNDESTRDDCISD